jgi:MFS family permease
MLITIRRFVDLLTRHGVGFAMCWSVIARLPVYLMTLAIVLVVREQGCSYGQAGLVSALYTLGLAAFGPVIARWSDRAGRRPVLLATGAAFPAAVAGLAWLTEPGRLTQWLCAILAGAVLPPANACVRTLWARLALDTEQRHAAYLWEALLTELLIVAAPTLLAVLMLTGSAGMALTTAAVVGSIGTWGFALSRTPETAGIGEPITGGGPLGALRNRGFLVLTALMIGAAIPLGLATLAIPASAESYGGEARTGFIYACWGIGSAVGALVFGGLGAAAANRRYPWFLLAFAAGSGLPALAWSQPSLAVALAVGGTPIALVAACETTMVSELADPRLFTEAFTWASTATVLGEALGQQAGGILVDWTGPRPVFLVAAAGGVVVALAAIACRRLLQTAEHTPSEPVN